MVRRDEQWWRSVLLACGERNNSGLDRFWSIVLSCRQRVHFFPILCIQHSTWFDPSPRRLSPIVILRCCTAHSAQDSPSHMSKEKKTIYLYRYLFATGAFSLQLDPTRRGERVSAAGAGNAGEVLGSGKVRVKCIPRRT